MGHTCQPWFDLEATPGSASRPGSSVTEARARYDSELRRAAGRRRPNEPGAMRSRELQVSIRFGLSLLIGEFYCRDSQFRII